jgi:hypothetical protein
MAKYEYAVFAATNAKAYRDYLARQPDAEHVTLTRGQLEAICRDLSDYSDLHADMEQGAEVIAALAAYRDADATAWAEQATRSAARIAELEHELRVARGMAIVRRVIAEQGGEG